MIKFNFDAWNMHVFTFGLTGKGKGRHMSYFIRNLMLTFSYLQTAKQTPERHLVKQEIPGFPRNKEYDLLIPYKNI